MRKKPLDYSWSVFCVKHVDEEGTSCFTADATVRDAQGKEVTTIVGSRMHAYVEAAEDDAIEAARAEIRRLTSSRT